jgi:hypothetical protein
METRTNIQICPNCGHENSAQADVCKKCKHDLAVHDRDSTNRLDKTSAIPDLAALGLDVTDYGDFEFDSADVKTHHFEGFADDDAPIGDGAVRLKGNLILTERETGKKFVIPPADLQEAVIGRKNQQSGYSPIIDLSALEGHKYGVSRRHATISYRDNWLILTDHNSTNGTFLNGHRLVPEQARVIRDKDTIRIGGIILHVTYEHAE